MATKEPMICRIAQNTYAINEYGMSSMFLFIGTQRALLIDAGCGTLDLKKIIAQLTDKPYDVVLTHNHGDHIGGIGQFEKVWIHKHDMPGLLPVNYDMLTGYVQIMGDMGTYNVYDVSPESIKKLDAQPDICELYEGQIFDLGDRLVTVHEAFGHTPGQCVFIDHNTRMLFSGDACNVNLLLGNGSITTALRGLYNIESHQSEFDVNWNGHIGYAGSMTCLPMPESVLGDCITICEMILAKTADVQTGAGLFGRGQTSFVNYGAVKISFDPKRLIDEGEAAMV